MTELPQNRGLLFRLHCLLDHPALGWCIVVLGILLRLRRYLPDLGLAHDDASLAVNIGTKTFAELLRPLDLGGQAAPVGFLLLQKCSLVLFGHGERAFRLVPFLAAVLVLPLFFRTARKIASGPIALAATAWIALAEPLIRYAATAKQYSTDVLWTTVLFALALNADTPGALAILAVTGAVLIWFSHPLLFVAGAIAITLFFQHLRHRQFRLMGTDVAMGILWLASFAVNYLAISRYYAASSYLTHYWSAAFAPVPDTPSHLLWYPRTLRGLLEYPLGIWPGHNFIIPLVAAIVAIAGCTVLARQRRIFAVIILSLFLAVAASALHKYPFADRLTLFCAPLLVLPLAFGLAAPISPHVRIPLAAILFAYPLYIQAKYFLHPPVLYDVKPAMIYVHDRWRPGDTLFLSWGSDRVGTYYLTLPDFALADLDRVTGPFDPDPADRPRAYAESIRQLGPRPRVWFVFSMAAQDDLPIYKTILNHCGHRLDEKLYPGGAVELYDLR